MDGAGESSSAVVPPYWQRHQRSASFRSTCSADNTRPTPIGLEDHTHDGSEQCKALWAKGVTIDDYDVVSGTAPGIGAYVVWNCTVETLDVSGILPPIHTWASWWSDGAAANRVPGPPMPETFPHASRPGSGRGVTVERRDMQPAN